MKIDAASKNLCQEFFELTAIEPPMLWAQSAYSGGWHVVPDKNYKGVEFHDEPGAGDFYNYAPAYDLDFLFELLPLRTDNIRDTVMLGRATDNNGWSCVWRDIISLSDRPADAVIVLLIKAIRHENYKTRGIE